jgi:hypothetical protein
LIPSDFSPNDTRSIVAAGEGEVFIQRDPFSVETDRIVAAYERRKRTAPRDLFSVFNPGKTLNFQELEREILALLDAERFEPSAIRMIHRSLIALIGRLDACLGGQTYFFGPKKQGDKMSPCQTKVT